MKINLIELANVLVVIILSFQLIQRRDAISLLLVLFVYGTLHFGFASIALATNQSQQLLIALHNEGGGILAKFSALALLGVVFALLSMEAYSAARFNEVRDKRIIVHVVLVMMAVLLGYIFNSRAGDWLQLKNFISVEVMLALVVVGYLALNNSNSLISKGFYSCGWIGLCILVLVDCIAIYEVFNHQSWAGTMQSTGEMVYRASSIMFNPNLLGFWASLVYLGCAYGLQLYKNHRGMMMLGMVLASVAIYFSGSRSAGFLLLAVMFIPALLMRKRFNWLSLTILPAVMLILYSGATLVAELLMNNKDGWREIRLLGLRFYETVPSFFHYIAGSSVPIEIKMSIEGRFVGTMRDSGWMVLYQDLAWLGLGAVIYGAVALFIWGVRAYAARPNITSAYALAILVYCLFTGVVMRFQIFPVWLFTGIVIIHCIVYWQRIPLVPIFRGR